MDSPLLVVLLLTISLAPPGQAFFGSGFFWPSAWQVRQPRGPSCLDCDSTWHSRCTETASPDHEQDIATTRATKYCYVMKEMNLFDGSSVVTRGRADDINIRVPRRGGCAVKDDKDGRLLVVCVCNTDNCNAKSVGDFGGEFRMKEDTSKLVENVIKPPKKREMAKISKEDLISLEIALQQQKEEEKEEDGNVIGILPSLPDRNKKPKPGKGKGKGKGKGTGKSKSQGRGKAKNLGRGSGKAVSTLFDRNPTGNAFNAVLPFFGFGTLPNNNQPGRGKRQTSGNDPYDVTQICSYCGDLKCPTDFALPPYTSSIPNNPTKGCKRRHNGNYQLCDSCVNYVTCEMENFRFRSCTPGLVWNDFTKTCVYPWEESPMATCYLTYSDRRAICDHYYNQEATTFCAFYENYFSGVCDSLVYPSAGRCSGQ